MSVKGFSVNGAVEQYDAESLANLGSILDTTLTQSGKAADAKATGDEIGDLKDVLITTTSTSLVNNADSVGTAASANTKRWLLPDIIPVNSHIGNVQYHTAYSVSGTVVFEVWKRNGDTLTLDKSVTSTPAMSSVNTVNIDYITTTDALIGWRLDGGTSLRHQANTPFTLWASSDLSSSTLSISEDVNKTSFTTVKPCVTVSYTTTAPKNYVVLPSNIVTIGPGMDYEQIQDALLAIADDSASKPYTLLLMPKGTPYEPFTMLRNSFSDSYPWSGVTPRHISIIGLDKAHCIIRSDSGDYARPCGEPLTNGIIKNLTFIMSNDSQTATASKGGYCLHIDSRPADDAGYNLIIEDCDFEDASGPCIGTGIHQDCNLIIRRCHFHTTLAANYSPHEGYTSLYDYGCFFAHTSTEAGATGQHLTLEDCVGICESGGKSLRVNATTQFDPPNAKFEYTLIRNVFWNVSQASAAYSISSSLTASPYNFGNNNS